VSALHWLVQFLVSSWRVWAVLVPQRRDIWYGWRINGWDGALWLSSVRSWRTDSEQHCGCFGLMDSRLHLSRVCILYELHYSEAAMTDCYRDACVVESSEISRID
jgi:hypothetical protein